MLVVKEPTYKIRVFNSINKATKVANRHWTRLSVWPTSPEWSRTIAWKDSALPYPSKYWDFTI